MGRRLVKIFGRGKEERERRREFSYGLAMAGFQGRSQGKVISQEQLRQEVESIGPRYLLIEDRNVLELVFANKPELFPIISRLNSTSKIEHERDRELLECYLEDMILHEEMNLEQDADPRQLQFLKALRYYGIFRILDAMKGYRGELVTETRERALIETAERNKKKGWL